MRCVFVRGIILISWSGKVAMSRSCMSKYLNSMSNEKNQENLEEEHLKLTFLLTL